MRVEGSRIKTRGSGIEGKDWGWRGRVVACMAWVRGGGRARGWLAFVLVSRDDAVTCTPSLLMGGGGAAGLWVQSARPSASRGEEEGSGVGGERVERRLKKGSTLSVVYPAQPFHS